MIKLSPLKKKCPFPLSKKKLSVSGYVNESRLEACCQGTQLGND